MSMNCDVRCQHKLQGLADWVAGGCTLLTFLISLFQIGKHLRHYTNPHFQRKIIIIIFMAPFYSLMSFFTVEFQDTQGYFDLVRDIYEAVLIYAFFNLLASYIAYDEENKEIDYERIYAALETKGVRKHMCPFSCCLKPILLISRIRAKWFFRRAKLSILQYLAIKPMVSFSLIIIAYIAPDGHWGLGLQTLTSVSVVLSVYYLLLFYRILNKELAFARPFIKFIAVKGVLFFTFWQDYIIEIFKSKISGHFSPLGPDGEDLIINELECILVCFEMVLLTILTTIAFSYKDFEQAERLSHGARRVGFVTLTRKFVNEVVADGVAIAFNDLKELKEPLKDPFKTYGDANIEQTDILSISMKKQAGQIDDEDLNEVHVFVKETPLLIKNFIGRKSRVSDSSTTEAFT